jgi:hypothetical protein
MVPERCPALRRGSPAVGTERAVQKVGYDSTWLEGEIEPPATGHEDLLTKPTVQKQFLRLSDLEPRHVAGGSVLSPAVHGGR